MQCKTVKASDMPKFEDENVDSVLLFVCIKFKITVTFQIYSQKF